MLIKELLYTFNYLIIFQKINRIHGSSNNFHLSLTNKMQLLNNATRVNIAFYVLFCIKGKINHFKDCIVCRYTDMKSWIYRCNIPIRICLFLIFNRIFITRGTRWVRCCISLIKLSRGLTNWWAFIPLAPPNSSSKCITN